LVVHGRGRTVSATVGFFLLDLRCTHSFPCRWACWFTCSTVAWTRIGRGCPGSVTISPPRSSTHASCRTASTVAAWPSSSLRRAACAVDILRPEPGPNLNALVPAQLRCAPTPPVRRLTLTNLALPPFLTCAVLRTLVRSLGQRPRRPAIQDAGLACALQLTRPGLQRRTTMVTHVPSPPI